jgi:hypothetical protein
VDNTVKTGNIGNALLRELAERLPSGWRVWQAERRTGQPGSSILRIRAPRGKTGSVSVQTKESLEPKDVDFFAARVQDAERFPAVIVARFLSARTRERLKARGLGYADLTGNIRLSIPEPAIFIETRGADENPFAMPRERKSLRGPKAGRLVRALCDFRAPAGLRELAKRAGIDAGYASRLVDFLDREALIARDKRGAIIRSDWEGLIRRWSQVYSPFERGRAAWYLAARGINQTLDRLKGLRQRYAVSGSWAAAQYAPVSPTRVLLCYVDDPEGVARTLDVRPTETGANVALMVAFDAVVYERTSEKSGVKIAAISQVAADLLTSPGRGPSEADALIDWMKGNEDGWRR